MTAAAFLKVLLKALPVVVSGVATAASYEAAFAAPPPGVTIGNAWMRALPDLPASGYFSLHNSGASGVTLTGAGTPACGNLTLHQTIRAHTMSHMSGIAPGPMAGMPGMTSMQAVAAITVPPGGSVRFTPGGYHLMCEQPGPGVSPGGSIPVTLRFADGSSLTSNFPVRTAAAR